MKILHTSDWHLGKTVHEYSLIPEQKKMIHEFLSIQKQKKYDAWIIAGDVFDRSVPAVDAVALWEYFLIEFSKNNIPLFVISGNHDSAERLGFGRKFFASKNIYFGTDPLDYQPIKHQDVWFYFMPYLHPGTTSDSSKGGQLSEVNHWLAQVDLRGKTNILIAHLFTLGGQSSESEREFLGGASFIPAHLFNSFDYVALGHLHKPQKVSEKIYYSGSPMPYSFSETKDNKRYLEIDTDSFDVKSIPLKFTRWSRKKATFKNLIEEESPLEKDHFLEISLEDANVVSNPFALLKQKYPKLLSIKQNYQTHVSQPKAFTESKGVKTDALEFYQYLYGEKCSEELEKFLQAELSRGNHEAS